MIFTHGKKLLFIGDSITDCGREKPDGEGLFEELGNGYVSFVNALVQSRYPELGLQVVNKGVNGDTVRELAERWQRDVVDQNPDFLAIMIGINDVWRQFHSPFEKEQHIYIAEYKRTLEGFMEGACPHVDKLILMTPFFLEKNRNDQMRLQMDRYGEAVSELAEKYACVFVDTQRAFDDYLEHAYTSSLAWDRVHPNATGHMILARTFLSAVGWEE
ncbi:SGNH/GDSL hydrolase family protein [Bacillus sp. H-16]|uniref:SGNH/GDSL hydrolase family protein n=1 Tax=Alteribacter salitolerans TaxID=2912333 RepID=UPI0019635D47|nr:SGNH/GDSL hydrolase family protein [Alteribacter salitolerans]MBM7094866.1 SGNH/GDSL hydrolase family protein [Alteribacter salitolerans]